MRWFGFWTLGVALCISAVAAYYSIVGLTTIFAAAVVPIVIMGSVLEFAKITTAVWLHHYWEVSPKLMKYYLVTATVTLMFITSMGIFGFLSKAHIEQTSKGAEWQAQLIRTEAEISRLEGLVTKAQFAIEKAESSSDVKNDTIQGQIDREQDRIDAMYTRADIDIARHREIIDMEQANNTTRIQPYLDQMQIIDDEISSLGTQATAIEKQLTNVGKNDPILQELLSPYYNKQSQIDSIESEITTRLQTGTSSDIKIVQSIVGTVVDGNFGTQTSKAIETYRESLNRQRVELAQTMTDIREESQQRLSAVTESLRASLSDIINRAIPTAKSAKSEILLQIDELRSSDSAATIQARNDISAIRDQLATQVSKSNILIQDLRDSIRIGDNAEISETVSTENNNIKNLLAEIDILTEQRYSIEGENRKLEAEVGPVKYIAELIYGDSPDSNLLEKAVRWVIMTLVFVFDPLAIALVLAGVVTITKFEPARVRNIDSEEVPNDNEPNIPETSQDDDSDISDQDAKNDTVEPNKNSLMKTLLESPEIAEKIVETPQKIKTITIKQRPSQ